MRKFKLSMLGFGLLLNGTLFLNWFSFSNTQEEFIKIRMVDFFTKFSVLFKHINNVFLYSFIILLIIILILSTISYFTFKNKYYFVKSFITSLFQLGMLIIIYIVLKNSVVKIHIGFYMAFLLIICQYIALLYFRKLIMIDSAKKDDSKDENNMGVSSQVQTTVVSPTLYQTTKEETNEISEVAIKKEATNTIQKNDTPTSQIIINNKKVSVNDILVFNNLKHLQRILLFIDIALFISLFLMWQSNVTKDNAITIALSSSLFNLRTKIVFVLFLQIVLSIVLFFKQKRIFIISSFLSFLLYIISVLTVTSYIKFSSLSYSPSLGFPVAIVGICIIILSYRNITMKEEYKVNLFTELKLYVIYIGKLFVEIYRNLKYLFVDWKNDK